MVLLDFMKSDSVRTIGYLLLGPCPALFPTLVICRCFMTVIALLARCYLTMDARSRLMLLGRNFSRTAMHLPRVNNHAVKTPVQGYT